MDLFTGGSYVLTRLFLQRGMAFIYLISFIIILYQWKPLLGENGITPVHLFLKRVRFWDAPSLFWMFPKNSAFMVIAWIGLALALLALTGFSEKFGTPVSMVVWFLLWLLMLSYVNVGQTWYSFGWETMLLEAGFLTIFLGAQGTEPPVIVIWLFRWMLFRLMFGAGLIKLRGDPCWRDFTCMMYHHETQPIPGPFSWHFHWLPVWMHKGEVLGNHITELLVPWGYFFPGVIGVVSGVITLLFHGWLFMSGNFALLGALTIVITFSTLNDAAISAVFPTSLASDVARAFPHDIAVYLLLALVALLSIKPVVNMFSSRQLMNASFEPLHLVNTYGAFGSITKERHEIVVEGTLDRAVTSDTEWKEYAFKGKPGNVLHRPPQISPYHLRLDWLMWFLPFNPRYVNPWFVSFTEKLLRGDQTVLHVLRSNPFPNTPPRFIRARMYHYQFTTPEEHKKTGAWWKRTFIGEYLPPVSF